MTSWEIFRFHFLPKQKETIVLFSESNAFLEKKNQYEEEINNKLNFSFALTVFFSPVKSFISVALNFKFFLNVKFVEIDSV